MNRIKVGVLGAGAIARASHIAGYAANQQCELTAIADISEDSLAYVRDKWNFQKEYRSYSELLKNEKLDLVSVCLPNAYHADAAIMALESGADVILEKPVATNLADAQRIRDAVERTGRRLAVCFSHRFNPMVRKAHEVMATGAIGDIYMARIRFAHNGPFPGWAVSDWFYNPELAGGGAVLDMGIHAIDLMTYFVGPITGVSGFTGTLRKSIPMEDNMVVALKFGAKAMGYIDCGWTSCAGFSGIELMGDKGALVVDYAAGEAVLTSGATKPDGSFEMKREVVATRGDSAWKCQMAELISQKLNHKEFTTDITMGIDALKVALELYDANRETNSPRN